VASVCEHRDEVRRDIGVGVERCQLELRAVECRLDGNSAVDRCLMLPVVANGCLDGLVRKVIRAGGARDVPANRLQVGDQDPD
jgi:hypothetical protein